MKKIISLTLTLAMLMGLSVSVLAVDDLDPPLWEQWGYESIEEMYEVEGIDEETYQMWIDEERFWMETEDWTDEQWDAYYAEQEAIWEAEYAAYIAEEKAALGLVNDINVMFRDTAVVFEDAVPEITNDRTMIPLRAVTEAFGAEVEYDSAEKTASITLDETKILITVDATAYTVINGDEEVEMELDSAPYIKDDRMYVPVRNVGEAFGYELLWDEEFRTAVILDSQNIIDELNSNYTIVNKILSMNSDVDMTKVYEGTVDMEVEVETYESIDPNAGTYTMTANADVLTNATSMYADFEFDLPGVTRFLDSATAKTFMPADQYELAEKAVAAMEEDGMEFIMDLSNYIVFYKAAIFDMAFMSQGVEWTEGSWLELNLNDFVGYNMADYYGNILNMDYSNITMGDLMYSSKLTYSPIYTYEYLLMSAETMNVLSDSAFEETSNGYSFEYTTTDEYTQAEIAISGEVVIEDDVAEEITADISFNMPAQFGMPTPMIFTASIESTATEAMVEMTYSMTDIVDVMFTATSELAESDATVPTAPAEGETVVDFIDLYGELMENYSIMGITAVPEIAVAVG